MIYLWLGLLAASLLFGGIQTCNLRYVEKTLSSCLVNLKTQNQKITEWQYKAREAALKAKNAAKKAKELEQVNSKKVKEVSTFSAPPKGSTCEERENATLNLYHRFRAQ